MTAKLPNKRPDCEKILEKKNSWALNEEEFEINGELKKELDDENKIVFSILKSKLKNSSIREKIEFYEKLTKLKH
jgi:hypothetical protein